MQSMSDRRPTPGTAGRPVRRWRLRAVVGIAVSALSAALLVGLHPAIALGDASSSQRVAVPSDVAQEAATTGEADVIVQLTPADPATTERQGRKLVDDVAGHPDRGDVLQHVGVVSMSVSPDQLQQLSRAKGVQRIEPDLLLRPALDPSTQQIGAPQAWAAGITGRGQQIAVVDSGIDTSHPAFAGKKIDEACFTNGSCPNGQATQSGPGSARPCTLGLACEHGTHVAGIVAGRAGQNGVAPDADLIDIQVFSRSDSAADCGAAGTPCPRARTSDVLAALDWLYANRAEQFPRLVAVNLSLSSDSSSASCDNSILAGAVDKLKSIDVATIVASGNGGYSNGLGVPACITSTVSVGATYADSDAVWPLSNVSPSLDLLAPGVAIDSPAPGGGWSPTTGTSAAAPHVAGAWALATQQLGTSRVDDVLRYLQGVAVPVADRLADGTVLNLRRLDVRALASTDASGLKATSPFGLSNTTQQNGASLQPASGDFNGDGRADIYWHARGGPASLWFSNGNGQFQSVGQPLVGPEFTAVVGDFDGDGRDDIFWAANHTFGNWLWTSRGDGTWGQAPAAATPGAGYIPVAGDFDGNGVGDIMWYGGASVTWIWYGQHGGGFVVAGTGPVAASYRAVAGDFDANGKTDVLWWDWRGGRDWTWMSQGGNTFSADIGSELDAPYTPTVGDFDGDGRDDILWYLAGAKQTSWLWTGYNGWQFTGQAYEVTNSSTVFVPVAGDFDGNRRADIYWYGSGGAADGLLLSL
jgi:subtilisin family serine protease